MDEARKQEMKTFLVKLRDSGKINMFMAPTELVKKFGVTKREAMDVFEEWAKGFLGGDRIGTPLDG